MNKELEKILEEIKTAGEEYDNFTNQNSILSEDGYPELTITLENHQQYKELSKNRTEALNKLNNYNKNREL